MNHLYQCHFFTSKSFQNYIGWIRYHIMIVSVLYALSKWMITWMNADYLIVSTFFITNASKNGSIFRKIVQFVKIEYLLKCTLFQRKVFQKIKLRYLFVFNIQKFLNRSQRFMRLRLHYRVVVVIMMINLLWS